MNKLETLYEAALGKVDLADSAARQDALTAFESVDRLLGMIHRIRTYGAPAFGFTAALIVIVQVIGWGYFGFSADYWLAKPAASAMGWAIMLLLLAGLSVSLWEILLFTEQAGFVPNPLSDVRLRPFRELLQAAADGNKAVIDYSGIRIDGPVFKSAWAIILFSQIPAHRRFRLPEAAKTYPDQLLIVSNLGPVTNQKKRQSQKKRHWMASVSTATYSSKSDRIAAHWPGRQSEQVKFALQFAFDRTRKDQNPFITATELEQEIVEALRKKQMRIGLGKTDSSEWINKMFGNGSRHDYAWVRRLLTEPGFAPPYELPLSN
jgi:hypothetical protein